MKIGILLNTKQSSPWRAIGKFSNNINILYTSTCDNIEDIKERLIREIEIQQSAIDKEIDNSRYLSKKYKHASKEIGVLDILLKMLINDEFIVSKLENEEKKILGNKTKKKKHSTLKRKNKIFQKAYNITIYEYGVDAQKSKLLIFEI